MKSEGASERQIAGTARTRPDTTMAFSVSVSTIAICIAFIYLPCAYSFCLPASHLRCMKQPKSSFLSSTDEIPPSLESAAQKIEDCKRDLIQMCDGHDLERGYSSIIEGKIEKLERLGEEADFGQASSLSGLISGEWELIYASDDITRSSPFFWAFRQAFPDSSDQIFSITDGIPAPIKMVGPATQTIDVDSSSRPITGTFISRVKVATLGGVATSVMTTRCTVLGSDGSDGLRLKVESTKPEDSTILQKLGPVGQIINSSSPPFPSGEALEKVAPGSSEIVVRNTYCDEGLRVTRNDDRTKDLFVWKRVNAKSFPTDSCARKSHSLLTELQSSLASNLP
eukprot:scaffold74184_cov51-Cyclotella_meneghiniana.AAC.1